MKFASFLRDRILGAVYNYRANNMITLCTVPTYCKKAELSENFFIIIQTNSITIKSTVMWTRGVGLTMHDAAHSLVSPNIGAACGSWGDNSHHSAKGPRGQNQGVSGWFLMYFSESGEGSRGPDQGGANGFCELTGPLELAAQPCPLVQSCIYV